MQTYPFGTFGPEHLKKVKAGIECFNQEQYWECHEELEHVWLEDRADPARNVYWAIIQVAASLYHVREGNIIGARGLLKKSKEKFRRCEDMNIETDLCYKYLSWQELKQLVFAIDSEHSELSDFKALYGFQFKHYREDI